jgi:hypothetical protein
VNLLLKPKTKGDSVCVLVEVIAVVLIIHTSFVLGGCFGCVFLYANPPRKYHQLLASWVLQLANGRGMGWRSKYTIPPT